MERPKRDGDGRGLDATVGMRASTSLVENQAFRFADKPIYATQFHPELSVENLIGRIRTYPEYAEKILGMTPDEFAETCRETPGAEHLMRRFVEEVFG